MGFSGGLRRAGCPRDKGIPDLTVAHSHNKSQRLRSAHCLHATCEMISSNLHENYEVGSVLSPISLLGKLKLCYVKNLLAITDLGCESRQLMPEDSPCEGGTVLYGIFAGMEGG